MLHWGFIFRYGFAIAGISTALHFIFYVTGWSFTHSLSGLLLMMARMFFIFLILLLAMSRMRQKVGAMNFLGVATHVLLMSVVAAVFHIGYDTYFYHQVDPKFDYKVYTVAREQTERNLADAKNLEENQKLLHDFGARLHQVKALQAEAEKGPPHFSEIAKGQLRTFLFQGLVNALILGAFFGLMLKPAPRDTSVGARVIYRNSDPDEAAEDGAEERPEERKD